MKNSSVTTTETVDTVELVLSITVPVEDGNAVDFGPLLAAAEKAIAAVWPGAVVADASDESK